MFHVSVTHPLFTIYIIFLFVASSHDDATRISIYKELKNKCTNRNKRNKYSLSFKNRNTYITFLKINVTLWKLRFKASRPATFERAFGVRLFHPRANARFCDLAPITERHNACLFALAMQAVFTKSFHLLHLARYMIGNSQNGKDKHHAQKRSFKETARFSFPISLQSFRQIK